MIIDKYSKLVIFILSSQTQTSGAKDPNLRHIVYARDYRLFETENSGFTETYSLAILVVSL